MLRFSHTAVGIQQGDELLFNALEDDGPMWSGGGPRSERRSVCFPTPFLEKPVVHIGIAMWDVSVNGNQRLDVSLENVTAEGFTAVCSTWGDTRVARVRVSWLAVGAAHHADEFEPD